MGAMRNAVIFGSEGKRTLGRPRCSWENCIKLEMGCKYVDWINLAQDRDK
jgi:hypothetical protein